MTVTENKIKLARKKSIEWIKYMATNSEKRLQKRIRVNHAQYAIAVKENMEDMCELLDIMEQIIIAAIFYKEDNNIPDAPDEIELAIADMETVVIKTNQHEEILNEQRAPVKKSNQKQQQQKDSDSQISLF